MSSPARRFMGETAVYGLGGMVSQALGIVLVPFYARELGVANYGVTSIINTTLTLGLAIAGLALPNSFFRYYLREASDRSGRAAVLETALGLRMVASVVGLAVFAGLAFPLATLLFGDAEMTPLLLAVAVIIFLDSLNTLPLSVLRAEHEAARYAALAFSRAVVGTVLILYLVVFAKLGVAGVVFGSLASAGITTFVGYAMLALQGRLRPRLERSTTRGMLAFSLPMVPAALAAWGLNISDRYVVAAVAGQQAVGVYSAGYTVGLVVNAFVVSPFALAWAASYWEIAGGERPGPVFARLLTIFVAGASAVALALSALGTDGIRILLGDDFAAGRYVVPFSAFAYVLYGVYTITASGLQIQSQTRWLPITMGAAAAANVAGNLVLVPLVGLMGAAYVNLASYALLAIMTGYVSQRVYPVPWRLGAAGGAFLLAFALAEAAILGPDSLPWRLFCCLVYPPLLVVLRIVRVGELRQTLARVRPKA